MQLALAALAILALHGIEPPPNNRHTANQWAARLRADITSQDDWDPLVPPTSDRSQTAGPAGHYSDSGTDVRLQVRFFKVENVKSNEGSMRIKVWFRIQARRGLHAVRR